LTCESCDLICEHSTDLSVKAADFRKRLSVHQRLTLFHFGVRYFD